MERALKYAKEKREKHISDLIEILSYPSISAKRIGIKECAKVLSEMLKEVGFKVELYTTKDSYPVIYGELMTGAEKTFIFYNHYDVQPVEPLEEWENDPFKPIIKDGRIIARGVADNKGNIMSRLKAIESYLKTYGDLPVNIKWVIEGEEEIGSINLSEFIKEYREKLKGEGIIWESGGRDSKGYPKLSFGCKGIIYIELVSKKRERDLHSAYASIVENPVWNLISALNALKDIEKDEILIPGFYDDVLEPSPEEWELLEKYPLEEEDLKESLGVSKFIHNLSGKELYKRLLYSPTCNICGIYSGYIGEGSKTVLPKYAKAKIDFRLVPNQKAEVLFEKIKNYLKEKGFEDLEIIAHGLEDPVQTPINNPLREAIERSAEKILGVKPKLSPRMSGTGPMALFYNELKIPIIEGVGCGHSGSNVHAPNENCLLEDYFRTIDWVIGILDEYRGIF
ncbi:MAG: M20/M25/M40 family metallo-hydrolase [Dictyoglomaceae bacterium]|nr:M20/M25/M40 family metallo-hydrolase [Dictyoglomaceae bacterium]